MAKQIYYGSNYAGGAYAHRSTDSYLPAPVGSTRYSADGLAISDVSDRATALYSSQSSGLRLPSAEISIIGGDGSYSVGKIGSGLTSITWRGASGLGVASVDPSLKRPAEVLYNQSILDHNTIGQSDSLLSAYSLLKRPRLVSASHLPVYPQRPGEKDCAHYMMTRTCKFGDACKFDHPIWVPEGGIPDWKEVPLIPTSESLPERPEEPDCPYYMKTQKCKYGSRCKFNHPKENLSASVDVIQSTEIPGNPELPERPSEPICAFYSKTGICKFGGNCKFHHPKDILKQLAAKDTVAAVKIEPISNPNDASSGDPKQLNTFAPVTPALFHNTKGLPIRPDETDCPFYLKTGSCKYGANCRYNHPDLNCLVYPSITANISNAVMAPTAASLPVGVATQPATLLPSVDPRFMQLGVGMYPQRPGEMECDYYMKTGQCKFAERCKFHHPIDRTAPSLAVAKQAQPVVKLTLAGLPRREGEVACPFYMKTGTCKYGALCRFDHPPPGEAIARATGGNGTADGEFQKDPTHLSM